MKMSKDDEILIFWNQFILDGNLDALSKIYFHFYDRLFGYGLKHVSDKQIVEDVIQDVFFNLIQVRKNIGRVRNLTGYLLCTFRRQLFLNLNKQKKTLLVEQLPEENFDYYKNTDQEKFDKENLELVYSTIRKCIGKLTARQQEIIFLRFESGISYEEISSILNISVESCYKSVYRSIKQIRSEVEKISSVKGASVLLIFFRLAHSSLSLKNKD